MSSYDGNYGEHDERDLLEAAAAERELEREHVEWEREQEIDRLRRDWPVTRLGKKKSS